MQEMTHNHTREIDIFYKEHRDNCTNCKKVFIDGDCAHLGHLQSGEIAFLCNDCSKILSDTVVRYHWTKECFYKPKPNDKLNYGDIWT